MLVTDQLKASGYQLAHQLAVARAEQIHMEVSLAHQAITVAPLYQSAEQFLVLLVTRSRLKEDPILQDFIQLVAMLVEVTKSVIHATVATPQMVRGRVVIVGW